VKREHFLRALALAPFFGLAQRTPRDTIRLFNDVPVAGSLTMTSVVVG